MGRGRGHYKEKGGLGNLWTANINPSSVITSQAMLRPNIDTRCGA